MPKDLVFKYLHALTHLTREHAMENSQPLESSNDFPSILGSVYAMWTLDGLDEIAYTTAPVSGFLRGFSRSIIEGRTGSKFLA